MSGQLTRGTFLRRAGGLVLLAAVPAACGSKSSLTLSGTTPTNTEPPPTGLAVFRLSTLSNGCLAGQNCSCNACIKHAENKIFADADRAGAGRAHAGCNCAVVQDTLPEDKWRAVFGDPGNPVRFAADRRDAEVARILS